MKRAWTSLLIACAAGGLLAACGSTTALTDVGLSSSLDNIPVRTVSPTDTIGWFIDARALAGSAHRKLSVADAGRHSIWQLDLETLLPGTTPRWKSFGGPGTGPGQFDGPVDLDGGSGLFLTVADRGNGRIQRFDSDGAVVEVLPIVIQLTGTAQPVAVVTTPENELFILDERAQRVVHIDRRREKSVEYAFESMGNLVDMTISGRDLILLDDEQTVVVRGALGAVVWRAQVPGAYSLGATGDGFMVFTREGLVRFNSEYAPMERIAVETTAPIRAFMQIGTAVYVLTKTHLIKAP